jgi:DNA (cytosine-5)-methyltransferase 1
MTQDKYTSIDLFCGAGGLSFGLENAGFRCIFAADQWQAAIETYNANLPPKAQAQSIHWETLLPSADIFVGGPPCQGFSSAGRRVAGDERNTLVAVFAHLVAKHQPKAFLFENVEGFLTGDNGRWVLDLLRPLIHAGYCISLRKVNAANYGVPQHRKRVIAMGGLGWLPCFPEPTHKAFGAPGAELTAEALPLCPTVQDALQTLPPAEETEHVSSLQDHLYKAPHRDDLERMKSLLRGQTMKDLPAHLWHNTYQKRAHRRVLDGTPTEKRGGAPAGLRRLDPEQPSKAITSCSISEYVHPFENRYLTLRECARLQTFPDDFTFMGTKSQKALLIGNAVPPRLAEMLGRHLYQQLSILARLKRPPGVYELTPTFSKGMSPALQKTLKLLQNHLSPFLYSSINSPQFSFWGA